MDGEINASRPVWGAWIEISTMHSYAPQDASRPVWGAWIEIVTLWPVYFRVCGRAPYGARGLKYPHEGHGTVGLYVAPRMGRVD